MNTPTTVRMVIGVLGLVIVIVLIGAIVLTLDDKALPESLIAIGSLAVGAIAGILGKTNDDVHISNTAADPVPVTDEHV